MIKGGYILQPRIIQESDISTAPPYVREIWNYLLRSANSKDNKYNGFEIKRGQLFRTYKQIRDDLTWYIGYRRMTYNENHTKKAMKALRKALRITTTKELGGVLITICNYDYYQNPKNYERTDESTTKGTSKEPMKNHPLPDNNKNNKNEKNNIDSLQNSFLEDVRTFKGNYPDEMLNAFYLYWSEPNKSKTKMRKDMEKTWDTSRRLITWHNRSRK